MTSNTPNESTMPLSSSGTSSLSPRFLAAGNFSRIKHRICWCSPLLSTVFKSHPSEVRSGGCFTSPAACPDSRRSLLSEYQQSVDKSRENAVNSRCRAEPGRGSPLRGRQPSQLLGLSQRVSRPFSARETVTLNHTAHSSKGSQLMTKAIFSLQCKNPFGEVDKQFPIQPAWNTKPKNAILGQTGGPGQRNSIVVVPGQEVFFRGSCHINRMKNNSAWAI